ncbi:MAG TPA: VOC family protein [Bacteroidales bacterium]|nr:VOC family protein [Bacteroidales bacterium]HNZ41799.1 VOC family protein [Bacteroidales bacterium]HOH83060.1 VOC family protein [Bacteroidales bacterium]HPB24389.1 VOC family protein [Bacteroidales bacterium]HPI29297.1 VOC family protein [Bacteroidales bacterium]
MNKPIYTCLWFDGQAHEAAEFYCSIFKNSSIISETPVVVTFQLNGRRFLGVNGGPLYKFSEAVSLVVDCDTQEEIDYYWQRLTDGGEESMCGWLKDKYGVSWQIIPEVLYQLMNDPVKAPLVFEKFSKIRKFIIADLLRL